MKTIHACAATHWGQEWFYTYSETNTCVVYHMDDVMYALENNILQWYHFDGHMSTIEEYTRMCPENFSRLQKLVQEGKLIIGPWYTQADEFVVSGESLIRNAFYGLREAKKYGDSMKIGYMPDSFGQTKDMPKILNGFGIYRFLFWRGLSKDQCPYREFIWDSVDGSSVLAYSLNNGYWHGDRIFSEKNITEEQIEEAFSIFLQDCSTDHICIPTAGDQRYVDFNLPEKMAYYESQSTKGTKYRESTFEKFFDELEKYKDTLTHVEGELLVASNSKIHRSIYSSRYDHKYYNDKIERRMIHQFEPIMVIAKHLGMEPKFNILENCWKLAFLNHTHDSACGCNSDRTNSAILHRHHYVDQMSYAGCDYIIRKISESFHDREINQLYIFNTLAQQRNSIFKSFISTRKEGFKLYDEQNNEIPYQIIQTEKAYDGEIRKDPALMEQRQFYYTHKIWIECALLPLGITRLTIKEQDTPLITNKVYEDKHIEDSFYHLSLNNGKIDVLNKSTGTLYQDILTIQDSADDGDTYDYSPPKKDVFFDFDFSGAEIFIEKGDILQKLTLKGNFPLPTCLVERQSPTPKMTSVPYNFTISLSDSGLIETKMIIDNTVKDHRMRMLLKTPIVSDHSIADSSCGTIKRNNIPDHINDWKDIGWHEEPSPIFPVLHFVGISSEKSSAFALLKGIKEYEILNNSTIALTMYRCVAFLGQPDLLRRPGKASGKFEQYIPTPDSQLQKELIFKTAFYLGNSMSIVEIQDRWEEYAVNPLYYQVQEINVNANNIRYFPMHPMREKLHIVDSLINIEKMTNINITAIIPCEDDSYTVRFLNNSLETQNGGEISLKQAQSYQWVNLNHEPLSEIQSMLDFIDLGVFKPEELKTLKIYFKNNLNN